MFVMRDSDTDSTMSLDSQVSADDLERSEISENGEEPAELLVVEEVPSVRPSAAALRSGFVQLKCVGSEGRLCTQSFRHADSTSISVGVVPHCIEDSIGGDSGWA